MVSAIYRGSTVSNIKFSDYVEKLDHPIQTYLLCIILYDKLGHDPIQSIMIIIMLILQVAALATLALLLAAIGGADISLQYI